METYKIVLSKEMPISSNSKNNSLSKGQTSLFSFFKKPETPSKPIAVIQNNSNENLNKNVLSTSKVLSTPQYQLTMHEDAIITPTIFHDNDDVTKGSTKRKLDSTDNNERKVSRKSIISDDDDDAEWTDNIFANTTLSKPDANDDFIEDSDDDDYIETKKKSNKKSNDQTITPVDEPNQKLSKPPLGIKPIKILKSANIESPSANMTFKQSPSYMSPLDSYLNSSDNENSNVISPSSQNVEVVPIQLPEGVIGLGSHEHNRFDFLKPDLRKDKKGNRMKDLGFDKRTLHVPESYIKDQTPAMQQWWQFKSENMDTVLFFKVGKFYELFHMDADVGMKELDLIYMKGEKAHSGFPEVSYGKFASALVVKGYRVARVEQTETPEMLKERNDNSNKKKEKVVRRELCSIMSIGTRTFCHLDDLSLLNDNGSQSSNESMLMCIIERCNYEEQIIEYGICCINTIIGNITIGQFHDDIQRSRLKTLLSTHIPTEILLQNQLEEGNSSNDLVGTIKIVTPKAILTGIHTNDCPKYSAVYDIIEKGKYFNEDNQMPNLLKMCFECNDIKSCDLLLSSFGCCIFYLKRSLIDHEIISLGKVFAYIPPEEQNACNQQLNPLTGNSLLESSTDSKSKSMILDANALSNLEILVNNYDYTEKGSLYQFLNRCSTSFGKRLLKQWLCNPLYVIDDIHKRKEAVEEILTNDEVSFKILELKSILKNMPDLERLLLRIYSNSLRKKNYSDKLVDHPDTRAVMYESNIYNSRKIKDFVDVLNGFQSIVKLGQFFENINIESNLLNNIIKNNNSFKYKEILNILEYFKSIFDEKQAKRDGYIKPKDGVDSEYDRAKLDTQNIENEFDIYLTDIKKQLSINEIKYFGTNKDRYQLEIPIGLCNKIPKTFNVKSQKKTHRRFWTSWIENKLNELTHAEERLVNAQNDTLRNIFEKFISKKSLWFNSVKCCAIFDALLSLAEVSNSPGYVWPTIISKDTHNQGPVLQIENGRHPMLEHSMILKGNGDYIPNTVLLGGKLESNDYLPKVLLLTGPNMGGKSTLLRQTCLIAIMAQLGCKIPADSCTFTPVDRIFTRVGASDRILSGQSTFFVELAETAMILKYSTEDSLCILDELGRGTATFDGTAIAHAVVDHLVKRNRCRSLFATHYHSLIDDWNIDPRICLGHMDCVVTNNNDINPTFNSEPYNQDTEVTFLYKLCDGSSPRSYGINVAKLARLPNEVIELAIKHSTEFELKLQSYNFNVKSKQIRSMFTIYFERLVSIVNSDMDESELSYCANEIWKRFISQL